ncbi:carboxypeptidase regulatory-like domain-containing protein [Rosistilla oblonga]|uniref:carboxypeptidase regulatory-like domain-containing protein n=1 Tax=Rosistilla oblonga TaxID=2527990 RepID=UPI003A96D256
MTDPRRFVDSTNTKINSTLVTKFVAIVLLLASVGCVGSGLVMPETGEVEGIVTMDGQPLPNVSIVFQPQENPQARASMAVSDEQGRYTLTYHTDKQGALIGMHTVSITTPTDAPDPSGQSKDPIPARYNSQSELVVEVKAGSNDIPLELTSK